MQCKQYNTIQTSTIPYNTIPYKTICTTLQKTIICNAKQCNIIYHKTIKYNARQCSARQNNTIQYNTVCIQNNTIQYNNMQYKRKDEYLARSKQIEDRLSTHVRRDNHIFLPTGVASGNGLGRCQGDRFRGQHQFVWSQLLFDVFRRHIRLQRFPVYT